MQSHARRRSRSIILVGVVLVAIVCSATATATTATKRPPRLGGTWSGSYSGAYNGTFTIHWKQTHSRLAGTIALSSPKGSYGITGSITRGKIHFGAVSVGARYTGTVSGSSMSGKWTSPQGGGGWSATKTSR